jgi:hypothetical protein
VLETSSVILLLSVELSKPLVERLEESAVEECVQLLKLWVHLY